MSAQPWKVVKEGVDTGSARYPRQLWTLHLLDKNGDLGGWLVEMQTCIASDDEEREADAATIRLIESAPDLLAALNAMLTHMGMDEDDWNKPTFDQARAAIRKATEQP